MSDDAEDSDPDYSDAIAQRVAALTQLLRDLGTIKDEDVRKEGFALAEAARLSIPRPKLETIKGGKGA